MKTIRFFILVVCLSVLSARTTTGAEMLRAYFAGISPFLEKPDREAAFQHLSLLVLEGLRTGETADVFDAHSLKPIIHFAIPEGRQFERNPTARAIRLKMEFSRLRRFLTNDSRFPEQPGAIKLPQFLALVSSHLRPPGRVCEIIILGSPFYVDPRERTFNMVQARFPSDAVLLANLSVSPFGTSDKRQALTNAFVHFGYLRDGFTNDLHRDCIERFLALFVRQQGGVVVSCASDPAVIFDRVRRDVREAFRSDTINLADRKPRMLSAAGGRVVELEELIQVATAGTNSVPVEIAAQILKREREMTQAAGSNDWTRVVTILRLARREVPLHFQPDSWCARLVDALVRDADSEPGRLTKRARLTEGVAVARACSGDDRVVSLKLGLLDAEDSAATREARMQAQAEHDGLLRAGDETRDLEQRLALFQKAERIAVTNGLSLVASADRIRSAESALSKWRADAWRRTRPADLPHGCQARVTRVTKANFPPFLGLDLSLINASGEAVRGLEAKDFQVTWNGRPVRNLQLASVTRQPQPISVVIALDHSGSMRGKPLTAAIQAVKEMLANMAGDPRVTVRVVTFSSDVRCVSDFTTNKNAAASSLDHVKAAGDTALYAAMGSAIDSLAQREGVRRLVVFSDGKDTSSRRGDGPSALAARLRETGIDCFAIGLRSPDLDAATLCRLADHYLEAADHSQLREVFRSTGDELRREVYRFVLAPELSGTASSAEVQIRAGGAEAVTVTYPVSFTDQLPAH